MDCVPVLPPKEQSSWGALGNAHCLYWQSLSGHRVFLCPVAWGSSSPGLTVAQMDLAQPAAGQWKQAGDDRTSIINQAPAPWLLVTSTGWAALGWARLHGTKGFLSCSYSSILMTCICGWLDQAQKRGARDRQRAGPLSLELRFN